MPKVIKFVFSLIEIENNKNLIKKKIIWEKDKYNRYKNKIKVKNKIYCKNVTPLL